MKFTKKTGVAAIAFGMAACGGEDGGPAEGGRSSPDSKFSMTCDGIDFNGNFKIDALVLNPGRDSGPCEFTPDVSGEAGAGGGADKPADISADDKYKVYSYKQGDITSAFLTVNVKDCTVTQVHSTAPRATVLDMKYDIRCANGGPVLTGMDYVLFDGQRNKSCNDGTYDVYRGDLKAPAITVPVRACAARVQF